MIAFSTPETSVRRIVIADLSLRGLAEVCRFAALELGQLSWSPEERKEQKEKLYKRASWYHKAVEFEIYRVF